MENRIGQSQSGKRSVSIAFVTVVLSMLASTPASAHGVPGGETVLEGIPTWLYLGSGAAVVLLSFAFVGVFANRDADQFTYRHRILDFEGIRLRAPAQAVSVLLYVGVIALGLLGPTGFQSNPAPSILVEIYWWVGYGIVAILVGNAWPALNPWKAIYEWVGEPCLNNDYPDDLGAFPALVIFLVFVWLNMVVGAFTMPQYIGVLAVAYGLAMIAGMAVYGKETWLWNADAFTRVFDFFGRFAPLKVTDNGLELRSYAVGLVDDTVESRDEVLLVIALLYTLSFDGFVETPLYFELLSKMPALSIDATRELAIYGGVFLVLGYAMFVAAYVGISEAMRRAARSNADLGTTMNRFLLTLIPIAVAYHIAHYSLYFFLQHELVTAAIHNPLPGGELHATPGLIGPLTPQFVWYYMVALIVVGHVLAVWVAHHVALEHFETRTAAIRSQIPMLALMVFYTVVSLWIISHPFGG